MTITRVIIIVYTFDLNNVNEKLIMYYVIERSCI